MILTCAERLIDVWPFLPFLKRAAAKRGKDTSPSASAAARRPDFLPDPSYQNLDLHHCTPDFCRAKRTPTILARCSLEHRNIRFMCPLGWHWEGDTAERPIGAIAPLQRACLLLRGSHRLGLSLTFFDLTAAAGTTSTAKTLRSVQHTRHRPLSFRLDAPNAAC